MALPSTQRDYEVQTKNQRMVMGDVEEEKE